MPKLTIVTVVLNNLPGLMNTRQSIEGADFSDWEHIIIDGGSTDGTIEYLREFGSRLKWTSSRDNGPYDAMNKGAAAASGEWTMFLNSGDTLASSAALRLLVEAGDKVEADLIYGDHFFCGKIRLAQRLDDLHVLLQNGDVKGWLRGHPCHQAIIARTSLLKSVPFDLSYRIASDYHWLERVRQQGYKSYRIAVPVCVYQPGGLSSRNFIRCIVEWWRVAKLAIGAQPKIRSYFVKSLRRYARRSYRKKIWASVLSRITIF
jgi:glycosyltransferase involved in cell wall biosynthesis